MAEVVAYDPALSVDARRIAEILDEQGRPSAEARFMTLPEGGSLKDMEAEIIRKLLAHHSAEVVCQRLGISRVTLWRKMKRIGAS